jgi:hypothetical protein
VQYYRLPSPHHFCHGHANSWIVVNYKRPLSIQISIFCYHYTPGYLLLGCQSTSSCHFPLLPPRRPPVSKKNVDGSAESALRRSRAHVHLMAPVEAVSFGIISSRRRTRSSIRLFSSVVEDDAPGEALPDTAPSKKLETIKIETPMKKEQKDQDIVEPQATTTTKSRRKETKPKLEAVASSPKPKKKSPGKSPTNKNAQGWESIYSLVGELRQDRSAPVDSDGSEALPQKDLGAKTTRFQVLIALMLSSQTKDAVVGESIPRGLQQEYRFDGRGRQSHPNTPDKNKQTHS